MPIDINRIKTLVRDCTLFAVKAKVSSVSESIRYITCGRYSVAIRKDETLAEKNANDLLLRFFHENGLPGNTIHPIIGIAILSVGFTSIGFHSFQSAGKTLTIIILSLKNRN